ncbi:hypothetical protein NXT3_CH01650 [Sinorhizobium fredii]|uniref:CD-NTase-associated protein 12/Pycsar effector protein TIR domain-containing protein n=1 Tax=Rhizobium fredii TaxID=380 RepID=A0A2L0H414_RHIFR|nr:hypothetical protein NXT3_CH01650 [Sinorhizobium fredii]
MGAVVSSAAKKSGEAAVQPTPKKLRLFYAWQSDLPSKANRNGIRDALKAVAKKVQPGVNLSVDEATRDTPGSPNIPAKIMEKIRTCDLFVADVTTIVGKAGESRPCANPNVIFELGYAVAHVGWDRIILVINGKVSQLSDLPFDFDRHRAMVYEHDEKPTAEQKEALAKDLKGAIDLIAKHDPPRPKDIDGQSEEQVRKRRDVTNITWALEQVHQPSIDDLIADLPYKLSDKALWYFECFKGVVTNSLFHINDAAVAKLCKKMLDGWTMALSAGEHYQMSSNPHYYVWVGNQPSASKAEDRVMKGALMLAKARKALLDKVRKDYVEVDVEAASRKAFHAYRDELVDH